MEGQIVTDGVLPAGVAGVVDPGVGVGEDGQQVVVYLGQGEPPPGTGDYRLSGGTSVTSNPPPLTSVMSWA